MSLEYDELRKNGVKVAPDGTLRISRLSQKSAINYLNGCGYKRIGKKIWEVPYQSNEELEAHGEFFSGRGVYIIGKGPSLDHLTENDLPESSWPIIAINDATRKIDQLDLKNPLYSVQIDHEFGHRAIIEGGTTIVVTSLARLYNDHEPKLVVNRHAYGKDGAHCCATFAIAIAKSLGASHICLVSCDAYVKRLDGTGYADIVKDHPRQPPTWTPYFHQRAVIDRLVKDVESSTVIPTSTSSDTPQPSQDSPEEHREPDQSEPSVETPATSDSPSNTEPSQHETPPDHSDTEPPA